jgi:hypothetical protein
MGTKVEDLIVFQKAMQLSIGITRRTSTAHAVLHAKFERSYASRSTAVTSPNPSARIWTDDTTR